MYLLYFSSPSSSHTPHNKPLKPHSWRVPQIFAPTSTNSITFSSNRFLIFTSFSKLIILLSVHAFLTTFIIFFLFISPITKACWSSPGIAFTFWINSRCSFFINAKTISVSFSPILNVTFLFSSLLDHVFDTHNSLSRQNYNNILPSKFFWPTPSPPWAPTNPSICLPTCPLMSPKHITKSSAECRSHSHFSSS